MDKLYVLVTTKHDGYFKDMAHFWANGACGYTSDLRKMGKYTKEEAEEYVCEYTHMIPLEWFGEIPESDNNNIWLLIEKGKINDILRRNGMEAIYYGNK